MNAHPVPSMVPRQSNKRRKAHTVFALRSLTLGKILSGFRVTRDILELLGILGAEKPLTQQKSRMVRTPSRWMSGN